MLLISQLADAFLSMTLEMAPYLLLGFLLAGALHAFIPSRAIVSHISKNNFSSVLYAALFGIPLPICSCGVLPTAVALRKEGASKGASVSFLISTPATGVDSILATYSLLGLPFAILRPVAAFVTSIFGGVLTNIFANEGAENLSESKKSCHCDSSEAKTLSLREKFLEMLRYGFLKMTREIGSWLLLGLFLGALVSAFVPDAWFIGLREHSFLCMLAVLILSMGMYTCSTGSIPLALALLAKGLPPGAAFVLLMAGPATSFASMIVVGKTFGKKTLATYLVSIAAGALLIGSIIDSFGMDLFSNVAQQACHHEAFGFFSYASAILLGGLILFGLLSRLLSKSSAGCCSSSRDEVSEEKSHCSCSKEKENVSTEECCSSSRDEVTEERSHCCCSNKKENATAEKCCSSSRDEVTEEKSHCSCSEEKEEGERAHREDKDSRDNGPSHRTCPHCKH